MLAPRNHLHTPTHCNAMSSIVPDATPKDRTALQCTDLIYEGFTTPRTIKDTPQARISDDIAITIDSRASKDILSRRLHTQSVADMLLATTLTKDNSSHASSLPSRSIPMDCPSQDVTLYYLLAQYEGDVFDPWCDLLPSTHISLGNAEKHRSTQSMLNSSLPTHRTSRHFPIPSSTTIHSPHLCKTNSTTIENSRDIPRSATVYPTKPLSMPSLCYNIDHVSSHPQRPTSKSISHSLPSSSRSQAIVVQIIDFFVGASQLETKEFMVWFIQTTQEQSKEPGSTPRSEPYSAKVGSIMDTIQAFLSSASMLETFGVSSFIKALYNEFYTPSSPPPSPRDPPLPASTATSTFQASSTSIRTDYIPHTFPFPIHSTPSYRKPYLPLPKHFPRARRHFAFTTPPSLHPYLGYRQTGSTPPLPPSYQLYIPPHLRKP